MASGKPAPVFTVGRYTLGATTNKNTAFEEGSAVSPAMQRSSTFSSGSGDGASGGGDGGGAFGKWMTSSSSSGSSSNTEGVLHSLHVATLRIQSEIQHLEQKLHKRQQQQQQQQSVSSTFSVPMCSRPGLRARRLEGTNTSADLIVNLRAPTEETTVSQTAFYSPSCHDWSAEQLMTSSVWTPYSSPRRLPESGRARHTV